MTEQQARAFFALAHIEVLRVWHLPNQYFNVEALVSGDEAEQRRNLPSIKYAIEHPWWLVRTKLGIIEIGWRKRVISIDWKDTGVEAIVTPDDVTKGPTYVHAWSEADAVKYLTNLATHLT